MNSLEVLRRLGASTRGPTYPLHVPMILDSADTAASLRSVDYVAGTLSRFRDITCALVGIGAWQPHGSSVREALPPGIVRELDRCGAVADVCSTILDAQGRVVGNTVPARCISITTEELRGPRRHRHRRWRRQGRRDSGHRPCRAHHRLITDSAAADALVKG